MKFYFSWWSKGGRGVSDYNMRLIYKLTEISVNLIKKHYNEVHLITDNKGKEIFKKLPWTSVDTCLEGLIPEKYSNIWNIGKIFSLNKIANLNQPFMHIDYDFFIIKKVNEEIFNKGILVQSKELELYDLGYEVDLFEKKCKNKFLAENLKLPFSYNCGIFGGTDFDFFKKYTETAINMVFDNENEDFWTKEQKEAKNFKPWTRIVLAEQYYLGLSALYLNKKINLFFEYTAPKSFLKYNGSYTPQDVNFLKESGCIHLRGPLDFKNTLYEKNKFIEYIFNIYKSNKIYDIKTDDYIENLLKNI